MTVERFAELMIRQLSPPYTSPLVRLERRNCVWCGMETDHEVGAWPEHPLERTMVFRPERRIERCIHCGRRRRHWNDNVLRIPRAGEIYPPPYLQRSA